MSEAALWRLGWVFWFLAILSATCGWWWSWIALMTLCAIVWLIFLKVDKEN